MTVMQSLYPSMGPSARILAMGIYNRELLLVKIIVEMISIVTRALSPATQRDPYNRALNTKSPGRASDVTKGISTSPKLITVLWHKKKI